MRVAQSAASPANSLRPHPNSFAGMGLITSHWHTREPSTSMFRVICVAFSGPAESHSWRCRQTKPRIQRGIFGRFLRSTATINRKSRASCARRHPVLPGPDSGCSAIPNPDSARRAAPAGLCRSVRGSTVKRAAQWHAPRLRYCVPRPRYALVRCVPWSSQFAVVAAYRSGCGAIDRPRCARLPHPNSNPPAMTKPHRAYRNKWSFHRKDIYTFVQQPVGRTTKYNTRQQGGEFSWQIKVS